MLATADSAHDCLATPTPSENCSNDSSSPGPGSASEQFLNVLNSLSLAPSSAPRESLLALGVEFFRRCC